MATPLKFRALGALIMDDDKLWRCRISPVLLVGEEHSPRPEKRWLPVDLWRTPSTSPDDPWFDDRGVDAQGKPLPPAASPSALKGVGITSIGPLAATTRQELGAVYVRDDKFLGWYDDYVASADPEGPPWRPDDWFNYELTSYRSVQGRRYHGYYAKVVKAVAGVVTLDVFDAYGRVLDDPNFRVKVTPGDPEQCDFAVPADFKELRDAGSGTEEMLREGTLAKDVTGGVYLDLQFLASQGLPGIPKIPIGLGDGLRVAKAIRLRTRSGA